MRPNMPNVNQFNHYFVFFTDLVTALVYIKKAL